MSIPEELERLSENVPDENNKTEKSELNGWNSAKSVVAPYVPRARLVAKDGRTLLKNVELPERYRVTIKNWFHIIIECNWRAIVILFAGGFVFSWSFFGFCYYLITMSHEYNKKDNTTCIQNVDSLMTAFLFSVEAQHTIGFGFRYMTDKCSGAVFMLTLQCICGVFLQTMLAGIVVAKVLRPKKRRQEMRFSRLAVIGPLDEHDHAPALMIRLADIQERLFLAESHVRLYMATSRINSEGHKELIGVKDMNVGYDSGWDRVLLLWPIIVRHVIDDSSPLYGMSKKDIENGDFELVMTVEGIVEATGMTFQARTSFLPDEIQWGYKFKSMVLLNEKTCKFEVHYNYFDQIERVPDFGSQALDEPEEENHHIKSGFI